MAGPTPLTDCRIRSFSRQVSLAWIAWASCSSISAQLPVEEFDDRLDGALDFREVGLMTTVISAVRSSSSCRRRETRASSFRAFSSGKSRTGGWMSWAKRAKTPRVDAIGLGGIPSARA